MASLLGHFSRQSKRALLIRGYLTVLLVTIADYVTGPNFSFLIFYFFPVITISWFAGRKNGITIAIVAAVATLAHHLVPGGLASVRTFQDMMTYWTFLQILLVFLMVSTIVVALRTSEDERQQGEQKLARKVQSFLMPRTTPPMAHFDYAGHSKSSDHLSGDLFDCFLVGEGNLAFMIGDICGKGISAALLMAYIQGVLRSHAPIVEEDLAGLMRTVNRSLHPSSADDRFATLFMGIYNDARRTLTYVNAGHDPPRVLRWNQNGLPKSIPVHLNGNSGEALPHQSDSTVLEVLSLETGGLLLGVDPSEEYVAHVMHLCPGDILVCDTDGLQEATNHAGEHYGPERLTTVVAENREGPASRIYALVLDDIHRFVGPGPQLDDMTLLIGKVV